MSKQPKTFEVPPRKQENATNCIWNAENTQSHVAGTGKTGSS
jgi:hypothetical protein